MLFSVEFLHQGAAQIHGHFSSSRKLLDFWLSWDSNSTKRFTQQFRVGWSRIARKVGKTDPQTLTLLRIMHRKNPGFWRFRYFNLLPCLRAWDPSGKHSSCHFIIIFFLCQEDSCYRHHCSQLSLELEKWHITWQKLGQRISLPHIQYMSVSLEAMYPEVPW